MAIFNSYVSHYQRVALAVHDVALQVFGLLDKTLVHQPIYIRHDAPDDWK